MKFPANKVVKGLHPDATLCTLRPAGPVRHLEATVILTGIADEAAADIESQVRTHQELGWDHIELRLVDGKNVSGELEDKEFDRVLVKENSNLVSLLG